MQQFPLALVEPTPEDAALDERHLRNALGRFATGVCVVTTRTREGKIEGLTANSFSAVSLDPPLVLWSLRAAASSLASFKAADHFAVNVLSASQHKLCRHFATRKNDKFEGIEHATGLGGCPLLAGALATFECSMENTMPAGDHVIFLGRVHRAAFEHGAPLIFSAGTYGTHAPLD
jgi:flavin reductase (DIM6/NTAB) family NADH-FMN oxidoreductase RutF